MVSNFNYIYTQNKDKLKIFFTPEAMKDVNIFVFDGINDCNIFIKNHFAARNACVFKGRIFKRKQRKVGHSLIQFM